MKHAFENVSGIPATRVSKKQTPPEIRLALEALARVGEEQPALAESWRKKLPVIARQLAQDGNPPDGALLEKILRENWAEPRVKALFRESAAEVTRPAGRNYASIVAALPRPETPEEEDDGDEDDDDRGYTRIRTLSDAVEAGRLDKVQALVAAGADIHARDDAAFIHAAAAGRLEIVRYLLERGGEKANIHAENDRALHFAAMYGHLEVVRYLLEREGERADIHSGHDFALSSAAGYGHLDIVEYLLGKGADVHGDQDAALRHAAGNRRLDIAYYLLEHGADRKQLTPKQDKEIDQVPDMSDAWRKAACREPPAGLRQHDPAGMNLAALAACADMLRQEGVPAPEANGYAWQAVRLFGDEQQVLRYLERWGRAGKQPLHDLVQGISCPQRKCPQDAVPPWDRKSWADAVMAQGPKIAKLVKFAARRLPGDAAFLPVRASDGKVSLALTLKEAAKFAYKRGAENPELAALCMALAEGEEAFELGLRTVRETPRNLVKDIPDIEIDGAEFGMPGARWRRLAPHDLRGLVLGEYTDCCQHLGGAGRQCALHGYQSSDGGFYVLETGKGEIIGQSWAWRGTRRELVLDSLETLGDRVSVAAWRKLVKAFAARLAEDPGNIGALHIGKGGGTPKAMRLAAASVSARPRDYIGYSDSGEQYRVAAFRRKLERPARGKPRKQGRSTRA
jgi:ankyrin repeat protein